jgi:hypothetical protein
MVVWRRSRRTHPEISAYILTYNVATKIEAGASSFVWADAVVVINSFRPDRAVYRHRVGERNCRPGGRRRKTGDARQAPQRSAGRVIAVFPLPGFGLSDDSCAVLF